ncbi:MAG: hypothetical protein K9N06_09540 [Candidatus Cloacimonetes bacterium]|nr:hypothetical protein [Candidatus Cloacimonadota bacterium]
MRKFINNVIQNEDPTRLLFLGYLLYVFLGWILLNIPFVHNYRINTLDNLFTSTSAISTTGLTTISVIDQYNFWGQTIVLILIQIGGLGYMTFGSFIILSRKKTINPYRKNILKTSFTLPLDFSIKKFIKSIVIYTLSIEFIGAVLLFFVFKDDYRVNPYWSAIFHSISSFCTAGFSLYNDSFINYADNLNLNLIISSLSLLGAIGYIVMVDVWLLIKGEKEHITFTSKVILRITFWLLVIGSVFFYFNEYNSNEPIQFRHILQSFFQTMTALSTVGFNTVAISQIKAASLFLISILMIIGASPSGTGGGIKSTTLSCLLGTLQSLLTRKKEYIDLESYKIPPASGFPAPGSHPKKKIILSLFQKKKEQTIGYNTRGNVIDTPENSVNIRSTLGNLIKIKYLGRVIPYERIILAFANFSFYFIILFSGFYLLLITETFPFNKLFFEAASALGTVGLSTGITSSLSPFGKLIIIVLMFIGRIGPITFGMALFYHHGKERDQVADIVV